MRRFASVFGMDLKNIFRNPVLVGYNTVFAALIILVMGYLTSGEYAQSRDAYQYYTVTMMVYGMLSGAMTASNSFMERDIRRPNLRILFSPAGSFPIYFSKTVASFLFNFGMHSLVLLVLCPLLHVSLGTRPLLFFALMLPVELFAASLGTFFCCLFHTEEAASTFLSLAISLLCVLGGTFFSLDGLGSAAAFLSRLSPVKWLNEAFFILCCDNSTRLLWPVAGGLAALTALLTLGCRMTFRTEDYI